MITLINWIKFKFAEYKRKKRIKKKIEDLKKRDPFIYKH
jgi:hypothetical protein